LNLLRIDQFIVGIVGRKEELKDHNAKFFSRRKPRLFGGAFGKVKLKFLN